MSTASTWTILVPTLGQRAEYLCQMLDGLLPQVEVARGRVKVLAYWDNGEVSIAAKKQALLMAADTDYVCFVDDDDTVSDDYVHSVAAALAYLPDYVGLKLQVYKDGRPYALSHHSLSHAGWLDTGADHLRRDITCANPMRTAIARTAKFVGPPRGIAEDRHWVAQLRGRLRTEVFVDKVLYHYWWCPSQSAWVDPAKQITTVDHHGKPWQPLDVGSPYFAWHPASLLPEGTVSGGPARHRPGTHSDLEHRPPAERVVRYESVGLRRPAHRRGRRRPEPVGLPGDRPA